MKHLYSLSLLLLALLLPATALAHDLEVGGIFYLINGDELTVTYKGTSYSQYSNEYSGSVAIPATVFYGGKSYSVTSIGSYAFYGCNGLTSISIGNSVTSIDGSAFSGCSGLTSVTIGNSVNTIGNYAFKGCSGITDLIWNARNCSSMGIPTSNIERVTIGNKVEILPNSFVYGSKITTVNIPNSVTSIGNRAFAHCNGLTSIVVANDNSTYDSRNNCNAIIETASNTLIAGCMNTTIPNSVIAIGNNAFYDCTGLTSIDIPKSVVTIGTYAFYDCSGLTSISIPNSVTSIGKGAFSGCSGLTSISIPNSVTSISEGAFCGCESLTSIDIPNSVTSIGGGAFSGCSGLTSIDIPNSVTSIGYAAFERCTGLTSILIPNSVTIIDESAFAGCCGLTSIVVESGNQTYDSRNNCNAIIESSFNTLITGCQNTTIPNSVTSIGDYAFYDCSGLTSIDIPNSVTSFGHWAFFGCSLTRVNITDLDAWCSSYFMDVDFVFFSNPLWCAGQLFLNGERITELVIPNSVTFINNGVFAGGNFTSVTIPNSVTSIGSVAFGYCYELTSVTIGNSVTTIDIYAFDSCIGLNQIYCFALTPPISAGFIDCHAGGNCYGATLFVPDIVIDKYQASDSWKDFSNIVGMPYTFEVDGKSYHATTMNTASVMANSDEGILYSGNVVIPDSVTYSGQTFAVTGIEDNAFDGCFELTSITIPNSVETIGEQAFQGCTGLKSVTIGSGVTAIGTKAFNYCNALETVKCLGTVPPVMASSDCFSTAAYNRATLLVPRNSESTYSAADYWYKFAHIDGWGSAGRGDIDGDGEVSIRDVTRMIDAILTGEHEGVYFESADLNLNGRLDIGDVTSIIDMLLNGN